METFDVIVVGAGISGLVAANECADRGARVLVLESGKAPGGRARSDVESGFVRNLGPHAVYVDGPLDRTLTRLAVPVTGGRVAGGKNRIREGEVFRSLPGSGLAIPFTSWLRAGERASLMAAFGRMVLEDADRHIGTSARAYVASIARGRARDIVLALVRVATYGGDLDRMSAQCAIAQLQAGILGGVTYLDGGWQSIVDGLVARASARGVRIVHGAPVRAVGGEGPFTVTARETDYVGASVVVTTSPSHAAEVVEGGRGPLTGFAASAVPVRAATYDVSFARGADAKDGLVLDTAKPFYLQNHSTYAKLAPVGGAMVHALRYDDGAEPDPSDVRAELDRFVRAAYGLPDEAELDARFLPQCIVHHALVTTDMGGFAGRPGVETGRAGVFVAGDWVGDHGLLADACAASATRAASEALAFLASPAASSSRAA